MNGNQKTAAERLRELAQKVEDGAFGDGDDLDVTALQIDLEDLIADLG